MAWLWVVGLIFYYLILPILYIVRLIGAVLSPVLHLCNYTIHGLLYPLRILARFETLYIYFGVAALVGVLTGSVLYLCSTLFVTTLDLQGSYDTQKHGSKKNVTDPKLEQAWLSYGLQVKPPSPLVEDVVYDDFYELTESGRGKRREGLLSQTILEEVDDSDAS